MKEQSKNPKVGDIIVEIETDTRAARDIRGAILKMAAALVNKPKSQAILVIDNAQMTPARIESEWESARGVFKEGISERMYLVRRNREGNPIFPDQLDPRLKRRVELQLAEFPVAFQKSDVRTSARYQILKVLLMQWLNKAGPTTLVELTRRTGYSYPTIAKVLRRVGQHIQRHRDRKIELRSFPRVEWNRIMAMSDVIRATTKFIDRSGMPRSHERLISKLRALHRSDVAIGGVIGAKHYFPALDLVGSPRLDLTVTGEFGTELVNRLDPALEQFDDPREQPALVIHTESNAAGYFVRSSEGTIIADPFECLLDLSEANLPAQAEDFLDNLIEQQKQHG